MPPLLNAEDKSRPAGGQTVRLPGSARYSSVYEQLYLYAEDLKYMIERNGELEARYESLQESCNRLITHREELDSLTRSSSDLHIVTDVRGVIIHSNPASAALAALEKLTGRELNDWVMPSYRDAFYSLLSAVTDGSEISGKATEIHLRSDARGDTPLIYIAQLLVVRKNEEVSHLHWILRDVTHLRETEFETQISTMVFKHADEGVMITDVEGTILSVNPAFCRITGYTTDEMLGQTPRILSSGKQDVAFYAAFWRSLREKGNWQGKIYNRRKNGDVYPEWLTVSAARDESGAILSYIAVFTDLSRLLRAEEQLSYLAHHDALTGLPNRLLFQDRLAQRITQAKRSGLLFTLIFIDLDCFKPINDTLGHAVGDSVLQEVANRLSNSVRECDTVARLGGDEFVILAPALIGETDIGHMCNKMIEALRQPFHCQGNQIHIGGSFGCAEYPRHGDDEVLLLKNADAAMYQAKNAGGNTYAIYDAGVVSVASHKERK
jgi:diguanylate cyclase (GGDEF)-like protein/PAS domain S-box-containing protein